MKRLILLLITSLTVGLLTAQTPGYDPDSPDDPMSEGYSHRLSLVASPSSGGSFNRNSSFKMIEGDSTYIYAYPSTYYRFSCWKENGVVVSTTNPIKYIMGTSDAQLTAEFVYDFTYDPTDPSEPVSEDYKYRLTLIASPTNTGSFNTSRSNSILMFEGDTQYVRAYPINGFTFVCWKRNNVVVSTANPYQYVMGNANDVLTAEFAYSPVSPDNPGAGYRFDSYAGICQGETYYWRGQAYDSTGVYYDSLTTVSGLDSVYSLTLTVYPSFFEHTVQTITAGSSFTWHGMTFTTPGEYYDYYYTTYYCDSIYKLTLNVTGSSYFFEEEYAICQGDYYDWHGHRYTTTGVYYDSLKTVDNMDSVYQLTLTVIPVVTTNVTVDACANGQLPTWATGFTPGTYHHYDTLMASTGCDSIIHTVLTVNRTYAYQQSLRMSSANAPYVWHNKSLSVSGVYYDSLTTVKGCDSVYQLTITFIDPYLFRDSATICQGESYTWRNHRYTASGIYYDSLKTADNVDSVYQLTLTVNPVVITNQTQTACANGQLPSWAVGAVSGNTYHHYDTLTAATGCDSIIHIALTVNPTYFNAQTVTWPMASGNYSWHGKTITGSGVYYDSLTTVNTGCDSIFQLNITFADKYLFEESHSICQGDYYDWHGHRYTTAGVYYDSLKTAAQVDSIYKLTLTVNQTHFIPEVHSICQGETYNWHNRSLTAAGVYYDSLTSSFGCDSVYELTLTVNPTHLIPETYAICQGDSYLWHNRTLTIAGVYYDSLQTALGCDSVYQLTLRVNNRYSFTESHAICQGDVYQWHGQNLTAAGVYYDSLTSSLGCDSIYELTLTVNQSYFVQEQYSVCQGETYTWHGQNLSTTGVYYDSLTSSVGCDSVYELTFTVNPTYFNTEQQSICQGDYYYWHGQNLTTAGVYYDSLTTEAGCDSVIELTLRVYQTYLVADTAQLPSDGSGYVWHGETYTEAGDYVDTLTSSLGCDSICTLHLTEAEVTAVEDVRTIEITLAPNPIHTGEIAYIYAEWTAEEQDGMIVEVLTTTGTTVARMRPETFPIAIEGVNAAGTYLVRITTGTGEAYIRKLIVH